MGTQVEEASQIQRGDGETAGVGGEVCPSSQYSQTTQEARGLECTGASTAVRVGTNRSQETLIDAPAVRLARVMS